MKAVMMAIRPKYCADILNLIKSIEIRTRCPHFDVEKTVYPPFKVYIYCSLGREMLWRNDKNVLRYGFSHKNAAEEKIETMLNGKVIAEFTCEEIRQYIKIGYTGCRDSKYQISEEELRASCLTYGELEHYAAGRVLYGWVIKDLKIYDKPLKISDFHKPCENSLFCETCAMYQEHEERCGNAALRITRPPQSWFYVEDIL